MNKRGPFYEEVEVGSEIPSLSIGPMTNMHLMRWSSAIENWHRIHYDQKFATEHDGLPDLLINGSWKQQILVRFLKDWVGIDGWLFKLSCKFVAMDVVGGTLLARGKVREKRIENGFGIVELDVGLINVDQNIESTTGAAVCILPLENGKEVPYPIREANG